MCSRLPALISLTTQSPEWGGNAWERIIAYMAVLFALFLLLIFFFVIFSSWWKKFCRERPKEKPAYTLEELIQMRKNGLISEAEYKTLRQKTLEEIEAKKCPTSDV